MPLTHTWTGWDGSTWDLTSGADGIRLVTGSVRGMNMPPVDQYRSESPMVAGSRYRGTRVLQREVFWPLLTERFDHTEQEFVVKDRAFWRTLDPSKVGTWTVTQPDGTSTRTLNLRFDSADDGMDQDPTVTRYGVWGITLVAEQPFWQGEPTTTHFDSTDSILVTNEGDVPSWITWTLTGPIVAGASIGIFGAHILIPEHVVAGRVLTVYTSPDLMVALWDDGTELVLDSSPDDYGVQNAKFKAVPEGVSTHMEVTFTGSGSVDGTLTPYYFRAY